MKKKSLIALFLLFGIFLTGCLQNNIGLVIEKPVTVTLWHYYNGQQKDAFDALIDEFNHTEGFSKGITVKAESKGSIENLEESITASAEEKLGAEKLPDIFSTYSDTAIKLQQMGLLADISDYMTEEELKEYNPYFLEEGRFTKDRLFILPVAKATELLYLNKTDWDIFAEEHGYDLSVLSTWEGIREVSEAYHKWTEGKSFFGRDAAANFMLVGFHQLGSDIFQKTNDGIKLILDENILEKIWTSYCEPYILGYYGAFGRFRSDDIKTGDIIAAAASTSSVSYYPQEVTLESGITYPIEVVVLPLPDFEGTKKTAVQQGAGMSVTKSSTEKEKAAIEFLKWFTLEENNIGFCVDSGYFPVKTNERIKERMKEKLISMNIGEGSLVYENTMLGLESILNSDLYAPIAFEEGSTKRKIITEYLTDRLEICKDRYNETPIEDRAGFLETCYKEWSANLISELEI
ncbi:MAG: extracellular solute-binding protein [Bacillota bacterium]|nr:extracellular solute-binding protein [Bacillota bacterium]NLL60572.1 extracellular solute-binding protein [Tissierellia bacterium]